MKKLSLLAVCLFVLCALDAFSAVRICKLSNGQDVFVDNNGGAPLSAAFQQCVHDGSVRSIDLPPGTYLVDKPIQIKARTAATSLVIRTAQLAGNTKGCQQLGDAACAVFLASPDTAACINNPDPCGGRNIEGGLLQVDASTNVILDHLIIDGNRSNRQASRAKTYCAPAPPATPLPRFGFNSRMKCADNTTQAERCEFTFNYTRNALCGTGLEFAGAWGRVQGNAAFNNGVHQLNLWADGLTVPSADHCIVNDNHIVNATDVGLIVGSCAGGTINSNWIEQRGVYAFAGLMLGNFCEGSDPGTNNRCSKGDYTGTAVSFNTVQCPTFNCGFGINLGPDPWTAPNDINHPNVIGGVLEHNTVSGARVPVNFGGAGTSVKTKLYTNTLTAALTGTTTMRVADDNPNCMARPNVLINLPKNDTGDSVVCGNSVDTDVTLMSMECFRGCFP